MEWEILNVVFRMIGLILLAFTIDGVDSTGYVLIFLAAAYLFFMIVKGVQAVRELEDLEK